ncbi:MAG: type IV secretion system protein, partial [Candidatus Moranbacteria bacterium]|nr:type IV secretion system protein [Candidatus Moranbacteria bacterium]
LLSIETGMEKTAMLFFSIIFLFILGTTLSAFGASLVIRLLALSLLITFSPVGFAFMFFPPTKSIADSWWENIIKYSLMGPILMLTLLITVLIFHGSTDIVISKDTDSQSLLGSFVSFFVPIAALWMGLIASQKFGAAASGMAMNFAKKTGSTLAKGGAHWVDRTLAASKYGKYFSPMAWKAGWKSRQTRLDQEAIAKSSGAIENVLEGAISRASVLNPIYGIRRLREGFRAEGMDKLIEDRKTKTAASYDAKIAAATQPGDKAILKGQKQKALKEFDDPGLMMRAALRSDSILKKLVLSPSDMDRTDRDFISKTNQANTEEKKIAEVSTNSGYALDELKTAIAQKDSNKVHGAILRLTKENDLNDLMMSDLGMAFGSDGKVDSEKLPEVLAKMYDAAGITNKEHIARNLMRIGEIGASNGNFGYYDMGKYDEKQGKFVTSAFKDRANNVVGKFRNFEPQTRQKVIHPDGMFVYSSNEDAVFSQMGMNILNEAITGDDLEQINRTRGDVKTKLHAFVKTVDSYSGTTSNPAAFKAKYEEVAKENITKKLNKQGLDENKDPAAFKKEFDKEFQKATSQTEIDKEMTRAKKAIEQYGQLNNIAKTYVRMGYHMEAGLEKKDAKDKAIKTVEQESPSPTP